MLLSKPLESAETATGYLAELLIGFPKETEEDVITQHEVVERACWRILGQNAPCQQKIPDEVHRLGYSESEFRSFEVYREESRDQLKV